jgi:hypothetical protein
MRSVGIVAGCVVGLMGAVALACIVPTGERSKAFMFGIGLFVAVAVMVTGLIVGAAVLSGAADCG